MKHLDDKIKPLENISLVDRVEKRIINYIKENGLKVGDALPKEMEFAESLGVSRTAVREAMLRLRTLGLVESKKHRGMVLLEPDLRMLSNLFELRLMLELGMVDFLFARRTPKQMKELEEIVNNSEDQRCDNQNFYLESEIQFHGKLYEMSGNEILRKFQRVLLPIFEYVHDLNRYQTSCII